VVGSTKPISAPRRFGAELGECGEGVYTHYFKVLLKKLMRKGLDY